MLLLNTFVTIERSFYILTDHKPLTFALTSRSAKSSPRQLRYLDFISQFTKDIRYVKCADSPVADALSRVNISATLTGTQDT